MAEFSLVQHAEYSPTKCAFCHTHEGPFIDSHLEGMTIATAQGMVDFQGHIYVCASKYREDGERVRTGCVEQMATTAKTMVYREALREVEIVTQRLNAELEDLRDQLRGRKLDLTVQQLQELLARA